MFEKSFRLVRKSSVFRDSCGRKTWLRLSILVQYRSVQNVQNVRFVGVRQLDHYSPKQVAQRLGVSESSVKRWLDQGVVPVLRTAGGHRRISEESLEDLLTRLKTTAGFTRLSPLDDETPRVGSLVDDTISVAAVEVSPRGLRPDVSPAAAGLSGLEPLGVAVASRFAEQPPVATNLKEISEAFSTALLGGDSETCERLADQVIAMGYPASAAADLLLTPAMHRVGACWEEGDAAVYQERRACGIGVDLVRRLRRRLPQRANGPVAIGGAPAGDHYQLPTLLVELALCEKGWQATSLGSNLPVSEFLGAVKEYRPRLLWISLSYVADEEAFVSEFNRLVGALPRQVAVLIGGRAATDSLRPRLRYTGHCDNLRNLTDLADSLVSGG